MVGHCIPPFDQAGAQSSQSPVDAEDGGDGTKHALPVPEPLVIIDQFLK
jgi:hypothetical protein